MIFETCELKVFDFSDMSSGDSAVVPRFELALGLKKADFVLSKEVSPAPRWSGVMQMAESYFTYEFPSQHIYLHSKASLIILLCLISQRSQEIKILGCILNVVQIPIIMNTLNHLKQL